MYLDPRMFQTFIDRGTSPKIEAERKYYIIGIIYNQTTITSRLVYIRLLVLCKKNLASRKFYVIQQKIDIVKISAWRMMLQDKNVLIRCIIRI